jgi:hypothetical protein
LKRYLFRWTVAGFLPLYLSLDVLGYSAATRLTACDDEVFQAYFVDLSEIPSPDGPFKAAMELKARHRR